MLDPHGAVSELHARFGPIIVRTSLSELADAQLATFLHDHRVDAIFQPPDVDTLKEIVAAAHDGRLGLYPISKGKNWGYGSKVPSSTRCAILDLSKLDRIRTYDATLGFVTVEPGVTFRQLAAFLKDRGSRFFIGSPATTPDASVLGNALERGIGVGRLADRAPSIMEFEVLLGDGAMFSTGLRRFGETLAFGAHRGAPGPDLTSLFLQSNLGIAVSGTFHLDVLPRDFRTVEFGFTDASLPSVVDELRGLFLDDVVRVNFVIGNRHRTAASRGVTAGEPTLTDWFGTGAIYSPTRCHGFLNSSVMRKALGHRTKDLRITSAWSAAVMRGVGVAFPSAASRARTYIQSKYLGNLGGKSLQLLYDEPLIDPSAADPDRDRRGLRWYAFVLPLVGNVIRSTLVRLSQVVAAHGLTPNIGLNIISGRAVYATFALRFDLSSIEEDANAANCYAELTRVGSSMGVVPVRSPLGRSEGPAIADQAGAIVRRIKSVLDPHGIISPGRYEFRDD